MYLYHKLGLSREYQFLVRSKLEVVKGLALQYAFSVASFSLCRVSVLLAQNALLLLHGVTHEWLLSHSSASMPVEMVDDGVFLVVHG
jgi:hypothetical protein